MNFLGAFRKIILPVSLLLLCRPIEALIMVGDGNAPVRDAGWPEGSLAVANLKPRVSWWEGPPFGGGEYHFDYRGGNDEFTEALTNFARILAPRLELFIHDE